MMRQTVFEGQRANYRYVLEGVLLKAACLDLRMMKHGETVAIAATRQLTPIKNSHELFGFGWCQSKEAYQFKKLDSPDSVDFFSKSQMDALYTMEV